MKFPQDERFRAEHDAFALRFTCEHCTHFDEPARRCAHGFRSELHQIGRYYSSDSDVLFCKEFELF